MRFRVGDRNPVLFDRTIGADQRSRADRSLNGLALGILSRPPSAVGLHHFDLRIGKEHKRQIKLGDKLIVRFDAVSADADNNSIRLCDGLYSVAEPARFFGSARRIVLWIEPKDHVLPGVIGKRMFLAVAPGQRKRRGFLPFKISHGYLRSGYIEFLYHTVARSIKRDVDRFVGPCNQAMGDERSDGLLEYWSMASKTRGIVTVIQGEKIFSSLTPCVVILISRGYISCDGQAISFD